MCTVETWFVWVWVCVCVIVNSVRKGGGGDDDDNSNNNNNNNNNNNFCSYLKAGNLCSSFRQIELCLNCCTVGPLYCWTAVLLDCCCLLRRHSLAVRRSNLFIPNDVSLLQNALRTHPHVKCARERPKRLDREAHNARPFCAQVKNGWSYTSTHPCTVGLHPATTLPLQHTPVFSISFLFRHVPCLCFTLNFSLLLVS